MRVAIYARYSSDRQNEASARDQIDRCRRYAEGRGWDVREVFSDEAISGASLDRPGVLGLRVAVDAGRVDVVVMESLDRLSRTMSEAMHLLERFAYKRVGVVGVADGVNTLERGGTLIAGIRATLAAEYLRDLSDKTRRGMQGRARAGLSTGCPPYGYRSRALEAGGFAVEIDAERAAVVRRIYADHAAGHPVRAIAAALNAEGIEPPRARPNRRGAGWAPTSVRAILVNERYTGSWSFGRGRWEKEPGTNRRRKMAGIAPQVTQRPDLAIVDRETWERVAARFSRAATPRRRVHHLLSGLLHCGACGTVMTIHGGGPGRRYYSCARARAGGGCTVTASVLESRVRERVVEGARDLLVKYARTLARIAAKKLAELRDTSERDQVAARLRQCESRIARLVDAVADGTAPGSVLTAIRDLEAQAAAHRSVLAELDARAAAELPTVAEVLARARDVGRRIGVGDPQLAREHLRDLVEGGVITAHRDATGWELRGGLVAGRLLDVAAPAEDRSRAGACQTTVVAGARFVQPLTGLVVRFSWCLAA